MKIINGLKVIQFWGEAVVGQRVRVLDKTGSLTIVKDEEILQVTDQYKPVEIQTRRGKFNSENYILLCLTTQFDNSPDPDDLAEILSFENS